MGHGLVKLCICGYVLRAWKDMTLVQMRTMYATEPFPEALLLPSMVLSSITLKRLQLSKSESGTEQRFILCCQMHPRLRAGAPP